jgi:hypothetical protein
VNVVCLFRLAAKLACIPPHVNSNDVLERRKR